MRMISTAQAEFEAPGAAISLVVSNVEILKVQQGYGLQAINRSDSIAAHALLSTEVLVVLDTHTVCSSCWRTSTGTFRVFV